MSDRVLIDPAPPYPARRPLGLWRCIAEGATWAALFLAAARVAVWMLDGATLP